MKISEKILVLISAYVALILSVFGLVYAICCFFVPEYLIGFLENNSIFLSTDKILLPAYNVIGLWLIVLISLRYIVGLVFGCYIINKNGEISNKVVFIGVVLFLLISYPISGLLLLFVGFRNRSRVLDEKFSKYTTKVFMSKSKNQDKNDASSENDSQIDGKL